MADVPESVWLVGLSGAGKSTVGPLLARRLGYRAVDLDELVEALAGETIEEVFRRGGEARFRELEAQVTRDIEGVDHVVIATGGGWMARGDLPRSGPGRVRAWLRVRPEIAIHRLRQSAIQDRPLLVGPDPETALTELLETRQEAYAEAELEVDTDGREPSEVAEELVEGLQALGVEVTTEQEFGKPK